VKLRALPNTKAKVREKQYPSNLFRQAPLDISELYTLRDIEELFGKTDYDVYRAVHEGKLHRYQRQRGRVFYAAWEVQAVFGRTIFNNPKRGSRAGQYENGGDLAA
jgi:hypothetical protein